MKTVSTELLEQTICPNCWTDFSIEDVKWISGHEELMGDYRLGTDQPIRFRPTRFDVQGNAIDTKGISCQELACPSCHLKIPRSALVFKPFFLSIVGTPSCGKSFYLSSLIWESRKTLPNQFQIQLKDSDGDNNRILNGYEEQLFFSSHETPYTKLAKTDTAGDWYSSVQYEDQVITYPKPFYFDLQPSAQHFNHDLRKQLSRLLCLYDNAGESFLPGADSVVRPVTRHLALAEAWLFCFDPTQTPQFRKALMGMSSDYQIHDAPVTYRQDLVLNEMISRIRRHSQMQMKEKSKKPLIIACTKFDAWRSLIGELPEPWTQAKHSGVGMLHMDHIEKVSQQVAGCLKKYCPEFFAVSDSLTENVYFVPVSATGCAPVKDAKTGTYLVPTGEIKPQWCEVPLLLALAHRAPKLVKVARSSKS